MQKRTSLRIWLILLTVFWGPWLLAWYVAEHSEQFTIPKMNYGTLISPMITLHSANLAGMWTIVTVEDHCDNTCEDSLQEITRVGDALGADRKRFKIARLKTLRLPEEEAQALTKVGAPWIIVDPKGEAMLSYHKPLDPRRMLRDVKRLMYVSRTE